MNTTAITAAFENQRACYNQGLTRSAGFRKKQLRAMLRMLSEKRDDLLAALRSDLGRHDFESYFGEIDMIRMEAAHCLENLELWMRPVKVQTPPLHQPGNSRIIKEPYGNVLVIAPWNYPVQLALAPAVGALAAGNCCIIKPSELAPHTSALLERLVAEYFDPSVLTVLSGGVEETTALLKLPFDYIFYTGSTRVGRIIMEAAAKNLCPVTLELGGKSPCIVDRHVSMKRVARRICFGKFFNAGQTCVAPDYVMVHEDDRDQLIAHMQEVIRKWYGDDPKDAESYARIITDQHFNRLAGLMKGGTIASGGVLDASQRYISPTLITSPDPDSELMKEEIFGPLLPILTYKNIEEVSAFINGRPKPLALYLFTRRSRIRKYIVINTSAGGVCINDTLSHLTTSGLPFGGVGESGMGAYHGKKSFDTFTHEKSVMKKSTFPDPSFRYPPYPKPNALMRLLTKILN
jgi:acyl-CoA reductase-like NAD-dependent aldehyde dehydrogenase